ncbi:hypothetical+protein [Methylocapsa aurea]|uniref:phage tail assembly chaperone n=1 Tax=Methylocapsa aurea TaxID=663610 RepID=UPI003D1891B5
MPKALLDRPEIPEHLVSVWRAFWSLTGDRPLGALGGVGRIPFTSIDAYAARFRSGDLDDFERFETLLRRIDEAYLAWVAEQSKKPEDG